MRVVMFYHSLVSDWNHGNAHFLRGVATELRARGHDVAVLEPVDGWSRRNLEAEHGAHAVAAFHEAYPDLRAHYYELRSLDLERELDGADLVIVHEWSDHALVRRIGEHRARVGSYTLLFHDTHHRAVTAPAKMAAYDLSEYDGVLVFGSVLRELYVARGWARRVWVWHEAADVRVFRPLTDEVPGGDLVWIGNWGDEERTKELREFLMAPVRQLRLRATMHGVRYPARARRTLRAAGIEYRGWLPNYQVPAVFARFRTTIHVPRRPYVRALPGIPTIRMFEALACGIPLVSAPWDDVDGLFTPGEDYLVARDGVEMGRHLQMLLADPASARSLAAHGLRTILRRHTCAHRVDELLAICAALRPQGAAHRARRTAASHARLTA